MKTSLNHVFRTIWSEALNTWIAVSELTPSKGKAHSSSLSAAELADGGMQDGNIAKPNRRLRLNPLVVALACCFSFGAEANPIGAQIANGTAAINQVGSTLTVTNSPGAIINWQGFSINAGETTRFVQQSASSSVLNRVVGPDPSTLLGTLSSNGRVFLINPAGIMVGQGAVINVPAFVASTLNLSNADFLANKLNFGPTLNAGAIRNDGSITTPDGGTVYLVAPQVTNNGIITTPKGETILAAGDTVTLVNTGTPGVTVEITGSNNTATNLGQVIADTGRIGMVGALVRNSGTLNASSIVSQGGRVFLKATQDAFVDGQGSITATGTTGGNIEVLGNRIALTNNAVLDASGTNGGGTVLVGGDAHGTNPAIQNAQATYVGSGTTIKADAIQSGNGGKVVVWADGTTQFNGNISARGGAQSGDGGWVETSGKQVLGFAGLVDTTAVHGLTGSLLLDPGDITISTAANTGTMTSAAGTDPVFGSGIAFFDSVLTGGPSNLSVATLQTQLASSNVLVTTQYGTGGTGNITVANPITWSSANSLAFRADGSITVNAGASIQGTGTGGLGMLALGNISITDAVVSTASGNMSIYVGGNLTLTAINNWTTLKSGGTQTISFTGAGAHAMTLAGGTVANSAVSGASAVIESIGAQTISYSGGTLGITLTGGNVATNTQAAYVYVNGVQQFDINNNPLTFCTACVTWNWAGIESGGNQSISASTITLNGGSGGNGNYASIQSRSTSTAAQSITTTGAITLTGGASGGSYFNNVTYPNQGASNDASIGSDGTQTINAGSISLVGGGGSALTLGGAMLGGKLGQNITTATTLAMAGGTSTCVVGTSCGQYNLGSPAIIGEQTGASIVLNVGGALTMAGGAANAAMIGAATGAPTISITAASIGMTTGSKIGVLTGTPGGTLTMTTTGGISQDAASFINSPTLASASASAGTIALGGANLFSTVTSMSASGNIGFNNTQTVHVASAASSGGNVTLATTGAGSNLYLGIVSGAVVNATSSGGIYDDNGSGVTNITATTSSTLISTGATLGALGISADVNTPSITATVSGAYGGIRIGSTGAAAALTHVALTDSATTTPQGVSFDDWVSSLLTLDNRMTFNAGTGALTVSARASNATQGYFATLDYLGSTVTGNPITFAASKVTGTLPQGVTVKILTMPTTATTAAIQQLITTTTVAATTTTSGSASSTSSGTPTVAPIVVSSTTTTSSGLLTTSGATTGGTTGTFGGNDPSLSTSTSSTTATGGSADSADDKGNGDKKDDSAKKEDATNKDEGKGKDDKGEKSSAKPEKC